MLEGVHWEFLEAILWLRGSTSQLGICQGKKISPEGSSHMTAIWKVRGYNSHYQWYERSIEGLSSMTSDMLEDKKFTLEAGFVGVFCPVLPIARQRGVLSWWSSVPGTYSLLFSCLSNNHSQFCFFLCFQVMFLVHLENLFVFLFIYKISYF